MMSLGQFHIGLGRRIDRANGFEFEFRANKPDGAIDQFTLTTFAPSANHRLLMDAFKAADTFDLLLDNISEAKPAPITDLIWPLVENGLMIEGAHHKQYYLEQIAELLDIRLEEHAARHEYARGIAP